MIIVMDKSATKEMVDHVLNIVKEHDLKPEPMYGTTRTAIGVIGDKTKLDEGQVIRLPGVKEILLVSKPYKRVSREYQPENTLVKINDDIVFGGKKAVIIAGPCGVESEEQIRTIAKGVKKLGAQMLRGGAFKPRTSPYSFQGMGVDGLKLMKEVGDEVGLPIVSECISTEHLDAFDKYADMIQIGARNMQNFDLLTSVAKLGKPILLKRGMSATVDEFMFAAEYILNAGNKNLVLCERGIRTFEQSTRNILDLNSLALIKEISHLPIIADPSHAAGRYDLVTPLARAGLAAGADGIIVEVHHKPDEALSDGAQSLTLDSFEEFMKDAPQYHHHHS
ncbi:3-deoxy-7-phosphoheptulonate synthase [Patescibacteria group bacterium]|nr:3-deoxy-7-phosphoheptulonate synthase [Patescibacteria group bacterium]MBU1682504.1 3-deoxy-7-phosphoheptulonate synthase [Patescibacteria group bacterium]MBU1934670.1 3-deoxy-7-phosphoheptulonate synthase [Patescibacteria group bacterium]